jgi:hypothetical protein
LKERFGFGVFANVRVQRSQVIEVSRRVGIFTKNLLANPERFLKERFGFGIIANPVVENANSAILSAVSAFSMPRACFVKATSFSASGIASLHFSC